MLVATTGRVKVKVDATNGPIQIGDLLVTSDKTGFAMKSMPVECRRHTHASTRNIDWQGTRAIGPGHRRDSGAAEPAINLQAPTLSFRNPHSQVYGSRCKPRWRDIKLQSGLA